MPLRIQTLTLLLALIGLLVLTSHGCKKGDKCTKTAGQHCSRYSDEELQDMYGGQNTEASREECIRGYAANCRAELEYGGAIPADVIIDPSGE